MIRTISEKLSWDKVGIFLSSLCAVHCLMAPVILAIMPLWSLGFLFHEWAHPVFLLFILPTIVLAHKKSGGSKWVSVLLTTGFLLLFGAWVLHSSVGHTAEVTVTLAGSATLIAGHWMNYKRHVAQSRSANKVL